MAKRMFEFRIYPSIKQTNRLKKQFFLVMKLYNLLLLLGRDQYQANGENLSRNDMNHAITRIKELNPEFCDVQAIECLRSDLNALDRLNWRFKQLFLQRCSAL